ncbi:uncharacterized protein CC84DRAFT_1170156 [Paraphaeosphaeria sporulosa]|uniref:Uncharacterized protein n=1 Tax=Paraphaeosphaeria sporulosa TaxID=1460663 RepID=A0A177CUI6_9PLEO|nr:uncharacterized protein CC84DRAFT_1170156 [Paraphaeosphaeria sporulosa]OAG11215.1 hypothetical protein CC84DRAFT_1170156 [Paraphaeosphaeria sporulosa]
MPVTPGGVAGNKQSMLAASQWAPEDSFHFAPGTIQTIVIAARTAEWPAALPEGGAPCMAFPSLKSVGTAVHDAFIFPWRIPAMDSALGWVAGSDSVNRLQSSIHPSWSGHTANGEGMSTRSVFIKDSAYRSQKRQKKEKKTCQYRNVRPRTGPESVKEK